MTKRILISLQNQKGHPHLALILKGQDVRDHDKEIGSSQQHSSKEIQVNHKITSAEANKGVMQLPIGGGQAFETLKAKSDLILGAQNHYLSESGTVGKFPREKLEFLCVNDMIQCSPCSFTKLLLDMNSKRKTILVEGGDGLSDFNIRTNPDDFHQHQVFSLHDTKKTITTGSNRVGAYSTTCQGSSYTAVPTASDPRGSSSNQSQPAANNTSKVSPLTVAQREARRQMGLCFYCDDKLTKGHVCKEPQHFMMIAKIPEVTEYEGSPKNAEDPRAGIGCWPEHELLLTALGGSNLHSSIFLPYEFGTSEGLEEQDIQESQHKSVPPENSNRHAGNNSNEKFELKGHFSFVDEKDIYNNLGILPKIRMSARKSVYDLQPVPIIDKVPYLELNALTTSLNHLSGELNWTEIGSICAANICGLQLRSLRTASSYDLGGLASGNHVFIFDPGGYGSNGQQTYVVDMFMDLIKIKEGMLDEAAIIDSTGGRLGQLQLQKGIRTQGQDTLGLQEETDRVISVIIQQYAQSVRAGLTVIPRYLVRKYDLPEMDWVVRLEDHMASRTSATTYVFDPGGCPGGVYGLDLLIVLLEFYMSSICCQRFQGQKLAISENQPKESCRRCRRHRKRLCLVIHEDMNPLMGEGMSGIACSIACNGSSSNSKGTTVIASVFVFELV